MTKYFKDITSSCFILCLIFLFPIDIFSQTAKQNAEDVYVDKKGVLRWKKTKAEAAFFGVNYTTPFAYAYRAHKALNVDLEKAIRHDVYHFARLGFDAFRVHVWDTEISDSLGNLLNNEHLRLFDFLLAELKKRNIKTIITPIAFWGNGYPERDERTPGFSRVYGKANATTNDTAIRAQENYLQQFFKHINPYTKLSYHDDADVIAVEINNEPNHRGAKAMVTNYINRLAIAIRNTGWKKPIYYNISQNPFYADAVAKAAVDGVSFQWYPSGLVSGATLKGNYLPHVDSYTIPFDTIPEFRKKSLMVYEFDAADLMQPYMYPAMAKSFRKAGFQWATQFAYDPMAIAHANTEYQTHYLNLAYTPSKAISMLIASEVFHKIPRLRNYSTYPADSVFDAFRLSHREGLSEMNTTEKFYYSSTTQSKPLDVTKLKSIAGVGNSPVVNYSGLGAYFLDKLEDGVWRLELMPDAISIRDPYERASPKKEVTRIQWETHPMQISLPDLGATFYLKSINEGNDYFRDSSVADSAGRFNIRPGTYLVVKSRTQLHQEGNHKLGSIELQEFAAPIPFSNEIYLYHEPSTEISSGQPFELQARIVGIDSSAVVTLQINRTDGGFNQAGTITMRRKNPYDYYADVPDRLLTPGELNYRIIVQRNTEYTVFPGNIKGNPFSWDNFQNERWKTYVAADNGLLDIFNPTTDKDARIYPSFQRNFQTAYITGREPRQLILKLATEAMAPEHTLGFQYSFRHKIRSRQAELSSFTRLTIRARTTKTKVVKAKVTFIDENASAFSAFINVTNDLQDIQVPFSSLRNDSSLLLPRPYPGFLPLWFKGSNTNGGFQLPAAEKIEITIGSDLDSSSVNKPYDIEIEKIWVEKAR